MLATTVTLLTLAVTPTALAAPSPPVPALMRATMLPEHPIGPGKSDFSEVDLQRNLASIFEVIEKNRPTGCKGKLWNTAALSTTMGPSIKLDLGELKAFGGVAA